MTLASRFGKFTGEKERGIRQRSSKLSRWDDGLICFFCAADLVVLQNVLLVRTGRRVGRVYGHQTGNGRRNGSGGGRGNRVSFADGANRT